MAVRFPVGVSMSAMLYGNAPRGHGIEPVVLVSHSSSGAVASLVAETAPELVDHLFYIAAIVASRLRSAAAYAALPDYARTSR
jgi:pimeloyl-ACP methyl ester carboxylesterase